MDYADRAEAGIAAHFPKFAPAIRAVHQHWRQTEDGNLEECGLGRRPRGVGGWCPGEVER